MPIRHEDREADPEGAEVARHEAGEDVERRPALARAGDHLAHVPAVHRGEDLDQLGDDGARERAAGDDRRELPPERRVAAEVGDEQVGDDVGQHDRDDRGEPDQRRQRRLVVHPGDLLVLALGDRLVDEVRRRRGDDHHDAHGEDPDQQLDLHRRLGHREQDEGDERDAGHAVGLEAVGRGADRVARVVAGAVGDHARVPRVVFLDLEDDLHQVGADVGDLGEDAARHAEHRGAERLADGEADEAGPGVLARDEEQDAEHQQQLDADEQHADAHAGLERDLVAGVRLAAEAGERRAGVGEGVDPDAEPGHRVAARPCRSG